MRLIIFLVVQCPSSWERADRVHVALGVNLEKSGDPAAAIQVAAHRPR